MARRADSTRIPSRVSPLKPEDAALFDAAMKDVKAIRGRMETSPLAQKAASAAPEPKRAAPRTPPPPGPRSSLPALSAGQSADVDARTLDRLRRGRMRADARVDLHGMTQDEAHRTLTGFIGRAQAAGARCVIVITGKGRISEGGGVLRNQVPNWLNSPAIRPRILAFAPAQPRDGGSGALYVLLRRRR